MKRLLTGGIAIMLVTCTHSQVHAQGFINETEQEIRTDFKDNPEAEFHINYMGNDRVLTVVDNSVQMRCMFNDNGACCWSMLYVYNPKVLDTIVSGLDRRTIVIKKGETWVSVHKTYKVHAKIGYSTKMKATYVMFYSDELKFGNDMAKTKPKVSKSKPAVQEENLGQMLGKMPRPSIPNDGNSAILSPLNGTTKR